MFDEAGEQCVDITIISADVALESDESFHVVLTTRDDDIQLSREIAVVTIVDSTAVALGFGQSLYTVEEETASGEGGTVEVCVELFSSFDLERNVILSVSTTEGSATGM